MPKLTTESFEDLLKKGWRIAIKVPENVDKKIEADGRKSFHLNTASAYTIIEDTCVRPEGKVLFYKPKDTDEVIDIHGLKELNF